MTEPAHGRLSRPILIAAGLACVGMGMLGVAVPMLPATPFFLLAAWCFSRSSPRFSSWLLNHRVFGEIIAAYRERRGLSARRKLATLAALWASLLVSALIVGRPWAWGLLGAVACGVTVHILRMPCPSSGAEPCQGERGSAEPTARQ